MSCNAAAPIYGSLFLAEGGRGADWLVCVWRGEFMFSITTNPRGAGI